MLTSEKTENLMKALISARAQIKPAHKSGRNDFHRYDYANEQDWHDAVWPALIANRLAMSFSLSTVESLPDRKSQKSDKNGKVIETISYGVRVTGNVRLMHESGEWIEVTTSGEGQDVADKSVYKAITGAKKYGYALLFALPTTDDPEADEPEAPKPKAQAKPRQPAKPPAPKSPPLSEDDAAAHAEILSQWTISIGQVAKPEHADAVLKAIKGEIKHVGDTAELLKKRLWERISVLGFGFDSDSGKFFVKENANAY
jgi:hypothetical protein